MFFAVIQRPAINVPELQLFAQEYNPNFNLVGSHVTLVFPVSDKDISEDILRNHVKAIAAKTEPFEVHMNELELSWDQWLFLTPIEGREELNKLHDGLYTDVLHPMLRLDIPFVPHIALGHFAPKGNVYNLSDPKDVPLDKVKYEEARKQIEKMGLDFTKSHKLQTYTLGSKQ